MAKSEAEAKKLVPEKFHRWIKVFGKKTVREDANKEGVGSCDRCKEGVCSEEGKGVSIVERRERGGERVY